MSVIIISTRKIRCKDCMNLMYYFPNPDKYYKRHKCEIKNSSEALESTSALSCSHFEWNPTAMPKKATNL